MAARRGGPGRAERIAAWRDGDGRRGTEALSVRALGERERHASQVAGYGLLPSRGPRRSATVVPAPLACWQYDPARAWVVLSAAAFVAAWPALVGWGGGWPAARDEPPLTLTVGVVVLLLSTSRTTVSGHGLSVDVAGSRSGPSRVVALVQVREARRGRPSEDLPAARRWGSRWPGRTRVAVLHRSDDGIADQALVVWVRDPDAFAEALGRPLR